MYSMIRFHSFSSLTICFVIIALPSFCTCGQAHGADPFGARGFEGSDNRAD